MRAVVTTAPEAVELNEFSLPEPGSDEVRIRLEAASINPVDAQTIAGMYHQLGWVSQPAHTGLGWDVAGVVTAIGADAARRRTELVLGARVAGLSAGVDKPLGTFADEVVLPVDSVALIPEGLGSIEASTLPLNGLTAAQALELLGPPKGTLLITGAAGGVGGYACTLAVARGWRVLGLARETDREFVTSTGAAFVTSVEAASVDAVFDTAVLTGVALDAVKDGGDYVGVMPPAVPEGVRGITTRAVNVQASASALGALLAAMVSGSLIARVHATRSLSDAKAALAESRRGGLRGRIVLVP